MQKKSRWKGHEDSVFSIIKRAVVWQGGIHFSLKKFPVRPLPGSGCTCWQKGGLSIGRWKYCHRISRTRRRFLHQSFGWLCRFAPVHDFLLRPDEEKVHFCLIPGRDRPHPLQRPAIRSLGQGQSHQYFLISRCDVPTTGREVLPLKSVSVSGDFPRLQTSPDLEALQGVVSLAAVYEMIVRAFVLQAVMTLPD